MNGKIQTIKQIIKEDENTDGDYWIDCGNNLIYEILDTFSDDDWQDLKNDLENFTDSEHSIFSRAILHYNVDRKVDKVDRKVDIYKIFFIQFVLINDIDDADCLLQNIMYLEKIKNPTLQLLKAVEHKVKLISQYEKTIYDKEIFEQAISLVRTEIEKIK